MVKKAMDALKSILAERQAKATKQVEDTGRKWVRRGELEAKRVEEYFEEKRLEEEKWKADDEARLKDFEEHLTRKEAFKEPEKEEEVPAHILNDALLDDDAEPPMPVDQVIDILREMGFPITLFGENDMQRYKRLRQLQKESHEGKKNPDVVMLESLHQTQQQQMLTNDAAEQDDAASNDEEEDEAAGEQTKPSGGGGGGDDDDDKSDSDAEDMAAPDKSDSDAEDMAPQDKDKSDSDAEDMVAGNQEKTFLESKAPEGGVEIKKDEEWQVPEVDLQLMDKCDLIRVWARKALKAWEKELAEKPEEDKLKAAAKTEMAQHRQVRRDVRPLQKRLRIYVIDEWLLDKIHAIVKLATEKEYRSASEAYLDLSIGKAAWPVGVGCGGSMLMEDAIGLHDRFNRNAQVKDIAFALNDDVTRKFVQALKRLMNVAQRYWPPDDPSKCC